MRRVTPAMQAVADKWNLGIARRHKLIRRLARASAKAKVEAVTALFALKRGYSYAGALDDGDAEQLWTD